MFEIFGRIWRGIRRMFGYTTLKNIVGRDVALSEKMIDAINEWQSALVDGMNCYLSKRTLP